MIITFSQLLSLLIHPSNTKISYTSHTHTHHTHTHIIITHTHTHTHTHTPERKYF